jgi:uncharacterized repeat protein (TIGR01451 family)
MKIKSVIPAFLFFSIYLLTGINGSSQVNRQVYWIKKYGGTKAENPISVKSTPDGGTILCGVTSSTDFDVVGLHGTEKDIWLVKVDKDGVIQWQKTYLTTGIEDPADMILTSDGGYAICGSIQNGAVYNPLVLKLSNNGTLEWQKQFSSTKAVASRLTQTTDGGFAITGYMNSPPDGEFAGQPSHGFPVDLFVAKLDNTGTFVWGKTYGGSQGDLGKAIIQVSDGNLLVGADSFSNDGDVSGNHHNPVSNPDYWILKLRPDGTVIWKKCFGGFGAEYLYDEFQKDNRYYFIGTTGNSSAANSGDVTGMFDGNDIWFVVLDTSGTLIRQKCIGGTGNSDVAYSIRPTIDDNIILTGNSNSNNNYVSGNHGQSDYALIKIDSLGNKIWGKLFGNTSNESAGIQFGARASVNTDSSFSLLAGSLTAGGEIPALYGQGDLLLIRYIDTSLYQDLYTKINYNTNVFTGRLANYTLVFGKNNNTVSSDTVTLSFVKDSSLQLLSITRPPSLVSGDTLTWKIPKASVLRSDTILISFRINQPAYPQDSIRVRSNIVPYSTEYFQTNNFVYAASKIKNQNAGIVFYNFRISSTANINANKPAGYSISYSFDNQLDTLTGTVRLVKDPRMQYKTANPVYDSIIGDTLVWNFSVPPGSYNRFINLQLQADTPFVQLGDTVRNFITLRFNTQDTGILIFRDSIKQKINNICIPPNTVNTALPFPQGIQWLRVTGGTAYDTGTEIIPVSDSTFITSTLTTSVDGDIPAPGAPFENALVAKYTSNGNLVWRKLLGGNGTDRLFSMTPGADKSVIFAGHTASVDGIFSTLHPGIGIGGLDLWLSKLDSNGNTVWHKTVGGSHWEGSYAIVRKFRENRYVVVTSTRSNDGDVVNPYPSGIQYPWLFMIDEAGTILWQKVFRDTMINTVKDVQVTLNNEILIAGVRNSSTISARFLLTDSLGNIRLLKNYAKTNRFQSFQSGVVNADSTFVFTGEISAGSVTDQYCYGDHPEGEVWLAKFDKSLNLVWEKFYGGDKDESPRHIIKPAEGGYLVCGNTYSSNSNVTGNHDLSGTTADAWLIRTDDNGNLLWQKTIGGNNNDQANRMAQLNNNAVFVIGETTSYNNGDIYNSKGGSDAFIFRLGATNTISGLVYLDVNGNHIKDDSEPFIETGIMKSTKGLITTGSNITNGYFAIAADTGTYITEPVINSPYIQSFPANHTSTFSAYAGRDSVNFALVPVPGINDLRITLLPVTAARTGAQTRYLIKYENPGTTTISNGNIKLVKDARTIYDSASVLQNSIVSDTITWNFSNFAPLETREIRVYLKLPVPPAVNINDTLHLTASVNPIAGDTTPVNNTALLNQLVVGSFDPNDKTESHGSAFPAQQLANGEYLNYVIRFQNTGTDTAFRVLVRDTLNNKLNWSSFEMIGASHPYRLTIRNGNQLEWKFDPIILPDSNHSVLNSQGYIAYRIRPLATLIAGDSITNRAGIYFDFNPPVMTNTQLTVIDNSIVVCPGGSTEYKAGISGIGYQWQVNDGSGFVNLSNDAVHAGATTDKLLLTAPPASYSGQTYRCSVTTASGTVTGAVYQLKVGVSWTGAVSSAWENGGNWNCGIVPDATTNVFIDKGNVIVSSNISVRSIALKPGVQFWVSAGYNFIILH